jgi:RHS repeat-associated protein
MFGVCSEFRAERAYDGLDRLTQEAGPNGTVGYGYDCADRLAALTVTGQPAISYGYNSANRLKSITRAGGGPSVAFGYDGAARLKKTTLPDGITESYGYDPASNVTSIDYANGPTSLGSLGYDYDADNREIGLGGSFARLNLPAAVSTTSYDAANELTTWGSATLTYDANGNLTDDGTNTYAWNARNQLTSVSGGQSASYLYDPFGRRQSATVGGTATDYYLYGGPNPIQEKTGATTKSLLTGLGPDEYYGQVSATGTTSLLTDAQGSTLAEANAAGTLGAQYTYDPFGTPSVSGGTSSTPHQFAGRDADIAGTLQYNRARYYSPLYGRFLSEDPIGFAGGDPNLYGYAGEDPVNFSDPSGLLSVPSLGAFSTAGRKGVLTAAWFLPFLGEIRLGDIRADEVTSLTPLGLFAERSINPASSRPTCRSRLRILCASEWARASAST